MYMTANEVPAVEWRGRSAGVASPSGAGVRSGAVTRPVDHWSRSLPISPSMALSACTPVQKRR